MLLPRADGAGGAINLLVAGRCASMTHDGQSAARVSGACFVDGPGRRDRWPRSPAPRARCARCRSSALQSALRADGAYLGDGDPPGCR